MRMDARLDRILSLVILIAGMLLGGYLSVSFGKELQWDLAGYHFYNPFAFLNHRLGTQDFWPPSALQTFITPTLDFISYFLVRHFSPYHVEFMLGCLHGINFVLIYLIARLLLPRYIKSAALQILAALCCACMGMYSGTVFTSIGSFFNDNLASIFVLISVLLQLQVLQEYEQTSRLARKKQIMTGVMLGAAIGAKLTLMFYLVAEVIALLLLPLRFRTAMTMLMLTILGVSVGALLADGYWMYFLWQHYHNPFFPLFNGIFKSPLFAPINWSEPRYVPKTFWRALIFPFSSVLPKSTSELYFVDFRFAITAVLCVIYLIKSILQRSLSVFKRTDIFWLLVFYVAAYMTWELNFAIMRYAAALQMLTPIIIFLLVFEIFNQLILSSAILLVILDIQLMSFYPMTMERMHEFGADFFNVKLPAQVQEIRQATVLVAYADFVREVEPKPNHYLIPFFPPAWRFSGIPFHHKQYSLPKGLQEFVDAGSKRVYLLTPIENMHEMYAAGRELGLHPAGQCQEIYSDRQKLSGDVVLLCPMRRG